MTTLVVVVPSGLPCDSSVIGCVCGCVCHGGVFLRVGSPARGANFGCERPHVVQLQDMDMCVFAFTAGLLFRSEVYWHKIPKVGFLCCWWCAPWFCQFIFGDYGDQCRCCTCPSGRRVGSRGCPANLRLLACRSMACFSASLACLVASPFARCGASQIACICSCLLEFCRFKVCAGFRQHEHSRPWSFLSPWHSLVRVVRLGRRCSWELHRQECWHLAELVGGSRTRGG